METLNTTTITPHEKAVQINLDKRFFLVPKLHLGTHLLRQFHCRSRRDNTNLN